MSTVQKTHPVQTKVKMLIQWSVARKKYEMEYFIAGLERKWT